MSRVLKPTKREKKCNRLLSKWKPDVPIEEYIKAKPPAKIPKKMDMPCLPLVPEPLVKKSRFADRKKSVVPYPELKEEGGNPFSMTFGNDFVRIREEERHRLKLNKIVYNSVPLPEKSKYDGKNKPETILKETIIEQGDLERTLPEGMTDNCFQYFTMIAGRGNAPRFNLGDYRQQVIHVLQTRLNSGFKQDGSFRLMVLNDKELKAINKAEEMFAKQYKAYNKFLDHSADEAESAILTAKEEWLYNLALQGQKLYLEREAESLLYNIGKLEEIYNKQREEQFLVCRLMEMCFPSDLAIKETLEAHASSKFKQRNLLDVNETVQHYYDKFVTNVENERITVNPFEYYENPVEILNIFTILETESVRYLEYMNESVESIHAIRELGDKASKHTKIEIKKLQDLLKDMNSQVDKASELNEYFMDIIGWILYDFKNTRNVPTLLEEYTTRLKRTWEIVRGKKTRVFSPKVFVIRLERTFMELAEDLSKYPQELVRFGQLLMNLQKEHEDKEMDEQKKKKKLVLSYYDIISQSVSPPYKYPGRKLDQPTKPKSDFVPKSRPPSEELRKQEEYRYFFT